VPEPTNRVHGVNDSGDPQFGDRYPDWFEKMLARIELPTALSKWIRIQIPMMGDPSHVHFRSCRRIPFWRIPGNGNMCGLTLANRVYLRAEHCPIDTANRGTVELVFHELVHVMQFRKNPLLFPFRYLLQHLRYGYAHNPAEVEVR
jgi:hypothetical protein